MLSSSLLQLLCEFTWHLTEGACGLYVTVFHTLMFLSSLFSSAHQVLYHYVFC